MTIEKTIACLANSRKLHGRCVAGIELEGEQPSGWIRPISDREQHEVSEYKRQYEDGSDPRVLDVVTIPLIEHRLWRYQQENWLLDKQYYWIKEGEFAWNELHRLAEADGSLWRNGISSYNGQNDQIPIEQAGEEQSSLKLIHVDTMRLHVFAPGEAFGNSKRRVQGSFTFDGTRYALWITDPVIERRYLAQADGYYELGESFLTISLGEEFQGHSQKLIAAVIERPS